MPKWAPPATVDRIAGRPQAPGGGGCRSGVRGYRGGAAESMWGVRCSGARSCGRACRTGCVAGGAYVGGRMARRGGPILWGASKKNSAPPERVPVGRSREVRVIRFASRGGACCEEAHAAGPMPRKIGGCRAAATVARMRRPAGQATRSRTPLRLSDSTTTVSPACRRPSMISSESGSSTWSASVRFRARAP